MQVMLNNDVFVCGEGGGGSIRAAGHCLLGTMPLFFSLFEVQHGLLKCNCRTENRICRSGKEHNRIFETLWGGGSSMEFSCFCIALFTEKCYV
jgi:hypothetical protein